MAKAKWTVSDGTDGQDADPVLAGTYKLLKNFARVIEEEDTTWDALETVRKGLGQGARKMDGVNYTEMRRFIREFMDKWGLN